MTNDEIQKIADICSTADGGCSTCAQGLMAKLAEGFPQFAFRYGPETITVPYGDGPDDTSTYTRIIAAARAA